MDDLEPFVKQVLGTIPRSDQRRWADFYVRGLLMTPGRKTVTRIVQTLAAPPADQSLQQFINQSPWDWQPVRRDLAGTMHQLIGPEAWVVQPAFFLKSGDRSVAVTRQFVPPLAKLVNCQAAMSLWLAGHEWGVPVDWRLVLPASWANDAERRAEVGIPENASAEEQWECAVELVTGAAQRLDIPARPVVLDLRSARPGGALRRLQERGIRFLARVDATSLTWPGPRLDPGTRGGSSAALLPLTMAAVRPDGLLEATHWGPPYPVPPPGRRAVVPDGPQHRRPVRPLLVMVERSDSDAPAAALWVTNLIETPAADLVRLMALGRRTQVDSERLGQLGLTDFEGRSYRGWHHHVTLVSTADAYGVARSAALRRAG